MSPTVSAECREVLELIDAGTGALGRADRPTAAGHFARASESLFRQAATCRDAERKVRLARQAQELLATVRTLRGLPAAGSDDTAEPSDGGSSNATGDPETNPVAVRLKTDIRFDDVAGLDDVKEVLHLRLVYPLKHPEKLARRTGAFLDWAEANGDTGAKPQLRAALEGK